jgi:hypothetical protein
MLQVRNKRRGKRAIAQKKGTWGRMFGCKDATVSKGRDAETILKSPPAIPVHTIWRVGRRPKKALTKDRHPSHIFARGARMGLKGNPVIIGNGPAAVIGYELCVMPLFG